MQKWLKFQIKDAECMWEGTICTNKDQQYCGISLKHGYHTVYGGILKFIMIKKGNGIKFFLQGL